MKPVNQGKNNARLTSISALAVLLIRLLNTLFVFFGKCQEKYRRGGCKMHDRILNVNGLHAVLVQHLTPHTFLILPQAYAGTSLHAQHTDILPCNICNYASREIRNMGCYTCFLKVYNVGGTSFFHFYKRRTARSFMVACSFIQAIFFFFR